MIFHIEDTCKVCLLYEFECGCVENYGYGRSFRNIDTEMVYLLCEFECGGVDVQPE